MARNPDEIFDEIAQLTIQYQSEVSTSRRTWPKSIRERILELRRLEFSVGEISLRTKIAKPTIYCWQKPAASGVKKKAKKFGGSFLPVGIAKPVDAGPAAVRASEKTVGVSFPGGIRIEGASAEYLAELFSKMGIAR